MKLAILSQLIVRRPQLERVVAHRLVFLIVCVCLAAMNSLSQTSWRWLVVTGETSASESLCWVPNNGTTLIVVPGKEEACWSRIVRAHALEIDGQRKPDLDELCAIAARTLGKASEECAVPRVQSVFNVAQEPNDVFVAQTHPAVAEILRKVSETYKVSEYELVGDAAETNPKTGERQAVHMLIAFKGPNRYRAQGIGPGVSIDWASGEVTMVHDGSLLWFYLTKENQYGSIPASELATDNGDKQDLNPEAFDYFVMWRYRGAGDLTSGTRFLRAETIEVAGANVDCYVLSVMDSIWWIDKKRSRVVRQDQDGASMVFTTIKLGEPLPDSLFEFVPPPGARKVEKQ